MAGLAGPEQPCLSSRRRTGGTTTRFFRVPTGHPRAGVARVLANGVHEGTWRPARPGRDGKAGAGEDVRDIPQSGTIDIPTLAVWVLGPSEGYLQDLGMNKLIEELTAQALTAWDTENHFRALVATGDIQQALTILDRLDAQDPQPNA